MIDVKLAPRLRQHLVGEIGYRHPEMRVAEVDADGQARRRVERKQHGRPSAGLPMSDAERVALLGEESGVDQVGDDARDRRAGEPGGTRYLRPARAASVTQCVNDATAV